MLAPEYRRTLPELKARYTLEPSLKDIYVEGVSDRAVVTWFASAIGQKDVQAYDISVVNISKEWLRGLDLPDNNRSRVLALSLFLVDILGEARRAFCIADKDFEAVTGTIVHNSALIYTDFACMESYWLCEECFAKAFILVLYKREEESNFWLTQLASLVEKIYVIRFAAMRVSLGVALPDVHRCTKWEAGSVVFDDEEFIKRFCQKAGLGTEQFLAEMEHARAQLSEERRNHLNGHDLVAAFRTMLIRAFKQRELATEGALARCLMLLLDLDHCRQFEMFKEIERRIS